MAGLNDRKEGGTAELKASPRNKYLGAASGALRSVRDFGDRAKLPLLGGLGSLFLGKSPEELNEWSYGNAPMQMTPQGDRLPKMKRGRGAQVADTLFAAADLPALRALTAAAGRPIARALENSPLYDAARFIGEQRTPVSAIVKPKGGNWLNGSVEDALKKLKRKTYAEQGMLTDTEALLPANVAEAVPVNSINSWIEGPLTKYVKTRMASPEDEVRKLAEQGVLHYTPDPSRYMDDVWARREFTGNPTFMGTQPLAQRWEDLADQSVRPRKLGDSWRGDSSGDMTTRDIVAGDVGGGWAEKAPDDAMVYQLQRPGASNVANVPNELGFNHLVDELQNALDPASGLPRNLQLTPEAVQNMGMEKAVRRVAEINAWRAAQKIEANRTIAEKASMLREYPHSEAMPNPKGLRWVELKANPLAQDHIKAVQTPHGWMVQDKFVNPRFKGDPQLYASEKDALQAHSRRVDEQTLADQLKYEGEVMQNCVGGYCDDVLSGRTRIMSLRDAKGEPHVTVEIEPPMFNRAARFGDLSQEEKTSMLWNLGSPGDKSLLEKYGDDMQVYFRPDNTVRIMPPAELLDPETVAKSLNPRVKQIKGKQNKAPSDEYLPFVQDFVRNNPLGSQWSDVRDLQNTGLKRHSTGKYVTDAEANALALRHFGDVRMGNRPDDIESPWQYAERVRRYDQSMLSDTDKAFLTDWEAGNFAQGGYVHAPSWNILAETA